MTTPKPPDETEVLDVTAKPDPLEIADKLEALTEITSATMLYIEVGGNNSPLFSQAAELIRTLSAPVPEDVGALADWNDSVAVDIEHSHPYPAQQHRLTATRLRSLGRDNARLKKEPVTTGCDHCLEERDRLQSDNSRLARDLEHWRQEVGKLHSKVGRLQAELTAKDEQITSLESERNELIRDNKIRAGRDHERIAELGQDMARANNAHTVNMAELKYLQGRVAELSQST